MKNIRNLTTKQINDYRTKIAFYANSAQFKKAYNLSLTLHRKYPRVLMFAYLEAVFTAEDTRGLTKKQAAKKYELATKKLRLILYRLKFQDLALRNRIRNEYYWFSKQPRKQYNLGLEINKADSEAGHYSQGVGAAMLAYQYAKNNQWKKAIEWSKKSETAWLLFFKIKPNWFNAYMFYALVLGIQQRDREVKQAIRKSAKISGQSPDSKTFSFVFEKLKKLEFPK